MIKNLAREKLSAQLTATRNVWQKNEKKDIT